MLYSIQEGSDPSKFVPIEASLTSNILTNTWSPAVFKDDYRNIENFISTQVIGLDIDEGCSLEEAKEKFKDYKHLIGTTKSHQTEKHGVVCDRFRVILFLSEPITDAQIYRNTWYYLFEQFPFIDRAAKDPSRMFYPCTELVSKNVTGTELFPVLESPTLPEKVSNIIDLGDDRGTLSRQTLEFMLNGSIPGSWNDSIYKAAKDFQEQGYSEEEFLEKAEKITGHLDDTDISTVSSSYKEPPKYGPRITQAEMILTPSQLLDDALEYLLDPVQVRGEATGIDALDKLLGGGNRTGEVTVLHAEAKSGKSSLFHDIIHRQASRGLKVGYASREMRPSVEVLPNLLSCEFLKNMFLEDNIRSIPEGEIREAVEKWQIYFAGGFGLFNMDDFRTWALKLKTQYGVNHFFMDHLHFMLEDPEDHQAASKLVKGIKTFAIEEDVSIFLIIQPNKLMEGQKLGRNTLKGGSAIGQAIDNLITMVRVPSDNLEDGSKNLSKISVDFARHKVAKTGEFYLEYDPEVMSFTEKRLEPLQLSQPGTYQPKRINE